MASGQPACKLNSFHGIRLSQDSKQIWMSDDSKNVLYYHINIYFRITCLNIQPKRSMCCRLNLPTRTKYPTKNMLDSRGLWRCTVHTTHLSPYHMQCTKAKQVIFIGVHSVRWSTAFTMARALAHVADAGCLGSVIECCGSALLYITSSVWRVSFRYACLSSGLVI